MPFNPCGFAVQYIRQEGTDVIRPFRDSDIEVTRRWYRVPEGTPWLPFPTIFRSTNWEPFPYLREGAGAVWPSQWRHKRIGEMGGFGYLHQCGTPDDFLRGAAFDPGVNVVYDSEWIPDCCGRSDVCTFNLCEQTPEFGRPASQFLTYPIPHQDATDETPVVIDRSGLNLGDHSPAWPGIGFDWHPAGRANPLQLQQRIVSDENGNLQYQVDAWHFGALDSIARTINAQGVGFDFAIAGDVGGMALEFVDGVLTLSGTNFQVGPAALPKNLIRYTQVPINTTPAAGTNSATATPITTQSTIVSGADGVKGTRLPTFTEYDGVHLVYIQNTATAGNVLKIYPGSGQAFFPFVFGSPPYLLDGRRWVVFTRIQDNRWVPLQEGKVEGTWSLPTVTNVGISTTGSALTVGVTDPTTTPALSVNVHAALADLVALSAGDDLVAGDGAGGYSPVTIGPGLDLTGGVLSAPFVYPASGRATWATFAITGASNVYQATGNTVTLPAAGTYRIRAAIRGELQSSAVGVHFLKVKLRNNTAGADVADSETIVTGVGTTTEYGMATAPVLAEVIAAGSTVIELYAARVGSAFAVSQVQSDGNGRCVVEWERVA